MFRESGHQYQEHNIEVQIMMSACFMVEGAADTPSLSGGEFMLALIVKLTIQNRNKYSYIRLRC